MKKYLYIILLLLYSYPVYSQISTQGKDFWLTFGTNRTGAVFQIRIIAYEATTVTFSYTAGYSRVISLTAGTVYTHTLDYSEQFAVENFYAAYPGTISKKSLRIQSDKNISVYAIIMYAGSSDATLILPITCLGNSYYHLSYDGPGRYSIIATEDATEIYDNGFFLCTLNKGEVYYCDNSGNVSGKHITSNNPVAYFVINNEVNVPVNIRFADYLYEQLFPESLWGTSFMVPVSNRGKDRIIIIASQDGTVISHVGGTIISGSLNLNAGEFIELEIEESQGGCYIESNKLIAITSYLMSCEYYEHFYIPDRLNQYGDPAMAWIPPVNQFVNEVFLSPFRAAGSSLIESHYLLIVTSTKDKHLTKTSMNDGTYFPLNEDIWIDHPCGYSFCTVSLSLTFNATFRFQNSGGMLVLAYGMGEYEAYYYLTSGLRNRKMDIALYVNKIHYKELVSEEFCDNHVDIEAFIDYKMHSEKGHLRWIVDGIEEPAFQDDLKFSKYLDKGIHNIEMIVKDANENIDTVSASFKIDIEKININDTTVCYKQDIELKITNSPALEQQYKWYNNVLLSNLLNVGTSFKVSRLTSDTVFYIESISDNGCRVIDSVKIAQYPFVDLTVNDITICYDSTAKLSASSSDAVLLIWYKDVNYTDTIIKSASFETVKLKSDTVFYIEAISVNGCISRDTVHVTVFPLPDLQVKDTAVCYGATAILKAYSSDIVSIQWYSDQNYSDIIATSTSFTISALKSDTVFYVEAISVAGCISRDAIHITVNPLPVLTIKDTTVCYGKTVTVTALSNDATIEWYDDPDYLNFITQSSSFETPDLIDNTTYFVKAISEHGCISTGAEHIEIYSIPDLIVNDITICYNSTAMLSASSYDVISLIWYKNANYTDTIIKSISFETAKLKSDTVFYIEAISVNGCISRDTVHVTVFPLPDLQVKDTAVCYGETVTLSASSSDALLFQWYSDTNYSDIIATSTSFTTLTLKSDTVFYVKAVSANGCISKDTLHIIMLPLPILTVKDTIVCSDIKSLLSVSSQNTVSLTWFSDAIYSDAIAQTSLYETVLNTDTVFYIRALSDKGCSTKDMMNISVVKHPMVVAMDDVHLCYGEELTLSVVEFEGTLQWNVDSIIVKPLHSQDYIITASRQLCPDIYDTVTVTVGDSLYIHPVELPNYKPYTNYDQQLNSNAQLPVFTLDNGNLPFGLILYSSGNILGNPYSDELISVFTVKVEDKHKCVATREYTLEKEFYTPKVFTPNNDGINDYFMKGYEIIIFDRLGIEIFKGNDGWDGTYKNKPAPRDIYFYKITKKVNSRNKVFTGYIGIE